MKRICVSVCASIFLASAFAYVPELQTGLPEGFIESSGVRAEILSTWLLADAPAVLGKKSETHIERSIYSFSISQKRHEKANLIEISVQNDSRSGDQSSWYFYKRIEDGKIDSIEVKPVPDSQVRLVFRPYQSKKTGDRSLLELQIYGMTVCKDIPVGLSFSSLFTAPLSTIISLTSTTVPWNLLTPEPILYEDSISAIQIIRSRLPALIYYDDGAFNHLGQPVHIEDETPQDPAILIDLIPPEKDSREIEGGVNCSGFVKWIVDGMIRPFSLSNTFIEPLKKSTDSPKTHFTEPFRYTRDLFFALDWTRNLASALVSVNLKKTVHAYESGVDVSVEPFAGSKGYEKNIGYPVGELIPYMYYLAIHEPGHMYLGALSRERGDPLLRQYHHAVALFPYFDSQGDFSLAVFESATETVPVQFVLSNMDAWIHLVRLKVPQSGFFQP